MPEMESDAQTHCTNWPPVVGIRTSLFEVPLRGLFVCCNNCRLYCGRFSAGRSNHVRAGAGCARAAPLLVQFGFRALQQRSVRLANVGVVGGTWITLIQAFYGSIRPGRLQFAHQILPPPHRKAPYNGSHVPNVVYMGGGGKEKGRGRKQGWELVFCLQVLDLDPGAGSQGLRLRRVGLRN